MKNIVILSLLASTLLLQSCSSSNEELDNMPPPPQITLDEKMKDKDAKAMPVHEKTHTLTQASLPRMQPKSLLINGIKMQPEELPLVEGVRIFIPEVGQHARVTGDIVVVSQNSALPESLKATYDVLSIAKNTFRLVPIKVDANMLEHYYALQKLDSIKQVELSIFYEGINDKSLEIE